MRRRKRTLTAPSSLWSVKTHITWNSISAPFAACTRHARQEAERISVRLAFYMGLSQPVHQPIFRAPSGTRRRPSEGQRAPGPCPKRAPNVPKRLSAKSGRITRKSGATSVYKRLRGESGAPPVVSVGAACHAGGRGFESRRSRLETARSPGGEHTRLGKVERRCERFGGEAIARPASANAGPAERKRYTASSPFTSQVWPPTSGTSRTIRPLWRARATRPASDVTSTTSFPTSRRPLTGTTNRRQRRGSRPVAPGLRGPRAAAGALRRRARPRPGGRRRREQRACAAAPATRKAPRRPEAGPPRGSP